ncbi:hypothetical protein DM02DRAFT_471958, partial [Periconia macrospinosa]
SSLSTETLAQIQKLLIIPNEAIEALTCKCILQKLSLDNARKRFDEVSIAHEQTFRWLLENEREYDDSQQRHARKVLIQWLATESGVFHILGKLGSGKSTLMKFLFKQPQTRSHLQKWAGQRKLLMGQFFFWKPGNASQKSLRGMKTSLLYSLLEQSPELTQMLFPVHWEDTTKFIRAAGQSYPDSESFSEDEIENAFQEVLTNQTIGERYRFCLFLDALDEYEENDSNLNLFNLAREIHAIVTTGNGRIKLCVSSRGDNAFVDKFNSVYCIKLQSLTTKDIERFTRDRLLEVSKDAEIDVLVRKVGERADGIFLWTSLVVAQLRKCLD